MCKKCVLDDLDQISRFISIGSLCIMSIETESNEHKKQITLRPSKIIQILLFMSSLIIIID